MPERCEVCHRKLCQEDFIDGLTVMNTWLIMCIACHKLVGRGLGFGVGYRYKSNGNKVE